jgi:hypothetical protein
MYKCTEIALMKIFLLAALTFALFNCTVDIDAFGANQVWIKLSGQNAAGQNRKVFQLIKSKQVKNHYFTGNVHNVLPGSQVDFISAFNYRNDWKLYNQAGSMGLIAKRGKVEKTVDLVSIRDRNVRWKVKTAISCA